VDRRPLSTAAAVADPRHSAAAARARATLARAGEYWLLTYEGRTHALRARRGLEHLASLLADPDRELHVLMLAANSPDTLPIEHGDALLDSKAKASYRARIEALRNAAEIAEATGNGGRAAEARAEMDAIAAELARALSLGGRDRSAPRAADRARAAVTLAVRRAIEAIRLLEPALGGHLEAGVRTGFFCSYRPDPSSRLSWSVSR
jgi:hypothetical protein